MMPDTFVALAGIALQNLEVPEKINFGGKQRVAKHQLLGGVRVVDTMGPDDDDLQFSGLFLGPFAADQARFIDYLRKAGNPVTLTYGSAAYFVVISAFTADYERYYQVPYTINLTVVQDFTGFVSPLISFTVDDLVNADLGNILGVALGLGMSIPSLLPGPYSSATSIAGGISSLITAPSTLISGLDLGGLAGPLSSLRGAITSVGSFVGITADDLAPVQSALGSVQGAISSAISQGESFLSGVVSDLGLSNATSAISGGVSGILKSVGSVIPGGGSLSITNVGGMISGGNPLGMASLFSTYSTVARTASGLTQMGSFVKRIGVNIGQGVI